MKKLSVIIFLLFHFSLFTLCRAQPGIINTIAGNGRGIDSGDGGIAIHAALNFPECVALDDSGNIYISELNGFRIRKINTSGIITTFAGNGIEGANGDGGPATDAELNYPTGVCTDTHGNLYIADWSNQVIRKVNSKTGIIHKIAGHYGFNGSTGDGGPATNAYLDYPMGISVDKVGNVYIADKVNNKIRKIDTSQIISTVAGMGAQGFGGDGGPATAAELYFPCSVCTDTLGNIFFTDTYNQRIRKVNISTGIISSVVGCTIGYGGSGYSGDGGSATSAELSFPYSVSIDMKGNIFIGDAGNDRIREVDGKGTINTIIGNGIKGFSGDGGQATLAELNGPGGIAIDSTNNIYLVDAGNMRIRRVNAITTSITSIKNPCNIQVFPNPATNTTTILLTTYGKHFLEIDDITGRKIKWIEFTGKQYELNTESLSKGLYFITAFDSNKNVIGTSKIVVQ